MGEAGHDTILLSLTRRWRLQGWLYCLLLSGSAGLLAGWGLGRWREGFGGYGVLVFLAVLAGVLYFFPYWRIRPSDAASWLDGHYPVLEDSCGLLLKPADGLGDLERLQAGRVSKQLAGIRAPRPLGRKLLWAGSLWVGLLLLYVFVRPGGRFLVAPVAGDVGVPAVARGVKVVPGIRSARVRIVPPAYTGRSVREQDGFDLQVEEGAVLSWMLETDGPVDGLSFVFNDTVRVDLRPQDSGRRSWQLSMPVKSGGFYQVRVGGRLSSLYKLVMIHDEAPVVHIRQPKPYTVIDFGESRKVALAVSLQDDYGISGAGIVATVASGTGEAVKFKEQSLLFDAVFGGERKDYDLTKMLDLDALGLKPGDELYFYCHAKDNHGQETRTDMYIISLPDTAKLMSLEGMTTGLDIKPELFRSERQIIIETEALLKAKDTIPLQAFKDKCNSLGMDQKLLRLRYGKFLGEEAEEGTAQDAYDAAGGRPEDFSNAEKVRDAFTDKHDNAEDATFLEPGVKQQLKATLTEMWNAELRLRTFAAQAALPYEYKALRLLKDLQQQSRAFVAKTGVKTTPLDLKKRMTGALDEIGAPGRHSAMRGDVSPEEVLRMALGELEGLRWAMGAERRMNADAGRLSGPSYGILLQALRALGVQASNRPAEYLRGYEAMKRICGEDTAAGDRFSMGELGLAEQAIRRLLPEVLPAPVIGRRVSDGGLSELYFSHVNEGSNQR